MILIIHELVRHRIGIFYFTCGKYFRRPVGCITFLENMLVLADSYFFTDFELYLSRSIDARSSIDIS